MNFQPILPGNTNPNGTSPPPEEAKRRDLSVLFQECVQVGPGLQGLVSTPPVTVDDLPQPPIAPSCQMPRAQCSFEAVEGIVEIRPSQKSVWDALVMNPQDCQGIVELNLRGCEFLTEGDIQKLGLFPNLKRLNLSCNKNLDGSWLNVKHLCGLEVLRLGGCPKISDRHLDQIIPLLTRLKELDLSNYEMLSDDHLAYLLPSLTKLKHLDIGCCDNVSGAFFSELSRLKDLESLDVSGCANLTLNLEQLNSLGKCKALKSLSFSGCENVSEGVCQTLNELPKLEFVDFTGCRGFTLTNDAVKHILQCQNLKRIAIGKTNPMENEALEQLKDGLPQLQIEMM